MPEWLPYVVAFAAAFVIALLPIGRVGGEGEDTGSAGLPPED